jgi:replicative DNA helicase
MKDKTVQTQRFASQRLIPRDISESLGKLPPQALDLETAVLGAAMLEKKVVLEIIDILAAEDFYDDRHKEIWAAIVRLSNKSAPIDMRTVVSELREVGKIELIGGAYYVAELTSKVSSAANVEYHARVVKEMSLKRNLIRLASEIHHDGYEDTTDVFELIDRVQSQIFELLAITGKKSIQSQLQLYTSTLNNLQKKQAGKGVTGTNTGFNDLNRITAGWQDTDLILIAARPGMGKTAFMICASKAAARSGKPAAIFSLEMSAQQLMEREMSSEYDINNDRMRTGFLEDHQWARLGHDPNKLSALPIYIDDTAALSIMELRAKCRRLKAEHGIQLIIIDYLQLMRGERNKGDNREQEIASISRALKGIAKELNLPVIALSQLSRAVETRGGDKRPQLSDLRESGAIEQDADLVAFLYRPEYYNITVDEEGMDTKHAAEVIVSKHRNGGTGTVKIKFEGPYTRFLDWDTAPARENKLTKITRHEPPQIEENRMPYKDPDQPF